MTLQEAYNKSFDNVRADIAKLLTRANENGRAASSEKSGYFKAFVTNRNFTGADTNGGLSNGVHLSQTYKIRRVVTNTCTDLQLAYTNYSSDPISVSVSVQGSDGTYYPVFFFGNRTVQIDSNGWVLSDPLGINLTKGDFVTVLNHVSVSANGQRWYRPQAVYDPNSGEATTPNVDYTAGGGEYNSYRMIYGPVAVFGRTMTKVAVVAGIGDSIMYGSGSVGEEGYMGAFGSYATDYSTIQMGQPGAFINDFIGTMHRKKHLLAACTAAITEGGVNDIYNGGASLASLQTTSFTLWKALAFTGIRVFQTTLTPRSTSSDSWTTPGNQAVVDQAKTLITTSYNDWLRDGAPVSSDGVPLSSGSAAASALRAGVVNHPLTGVFDVADRVETSRNSGIWKNGFTTDGVHLSPSGNAAAITAINVPLVTKI